MGVNTHFSSRALARIGFQDDCGHATSLPIPAIGIEPTGIAERAQASAVNISNTYSLKSNSRQGIKVGPIESGL